MNDDEFIAMLTAPESPGLDFKEAKNNFAFDRLEEYCVALANVGGGKIVLGVSDKRPRRVVGTTAFQEPGKTTYDLYLKTSLQVVFEERSHNGNRVLIFVVPALEPGSAAHTSDGRYVWRVGESVAAIPADQLRQMLGQVEIDFSAQVCAAATLDDLSPSSIEAFRRRWSASTRNQRLELIEGRQLLADAGLVDGYKITNAALILFGTEQALRRFLPQAEIVFEYRSTEASGPPDGRIELREGFFSYHDRLWNEINLRNSRQSYQDGLFRREISTFDEVSTREALLNAISHRDYRLAGSIWVKQFPHRLEVQNPGGLPIGVTVDNILDQQRPRNRRLAEVLSKCGLVERSGQGVNLMFETAVKQGKELPDFQGTSADEVRISLSGRVEDGRIIRFFERLGAERLQSFSTADFLVVHHVRRDEKLPEVLRTRLLRLVDVGVIERVGRGRGTRYLLARALYSAIGAGGIHTRKKGLDRETNKALLVRHLAVEGEKGASLAELNQVLPSIPAKSVNHLLSELREEGKVGLRGLRRWARWYATPSKDK